MRIWIREEKTMTNVMAEYKSKHDPGKVYRIYLSKDGKTCYCDCWQWKKTRNCTHLEHYLSQVLPTIKEAHAAKVYSEDFDIFIKDAIERAVSELS
jgi:hypothetical protein